MRNPSAEASAKAPELRPSAFAAGVYPLHAPDMREFSQETRESREVLTACQRTSDKADDTRAVSPAMAQGSLNIMA